MTIKRNQKRATLTRTEVTAGTQPACYIGDAHNLDHSQGQVRSVQFGFSRRFGPNHSSVQNSFDGINLGRASISSRPSLVGLDKRSRKQKTSFRPYGRVIPSSKRWHFKSPPQKEQSESYPHSSHYCLSSECTASQVRSNNCLHGSSRLRP